MQRKPGRPCIRWLCLLLTCVLLPLSFARAQETVHVLPPAEPVPEYVTRLLDIARQELGYLEKRDGTTKYGAWAGNPTAEWCAEFLCWAVDQTDRQHGYSLLKNIYPLYGATNVGLRWFLRQGRYIARKGMVNDWGSQWFLDGTPVENAAYVPQPGDWVFFSYTPSGDTTHVAMVEYAFEKDKATYISVIEGNNPDRVQRAQYALTDWRILGYGTVHELVDMVLRPGNEGKKVADLQQRLITLGLLPEDGATGSYNAATKNAVFTFQTQEALTQTGIANRQTQQKLLERVQEKLDQQNDLWIVADGQ